MLDSQAGEQAEGASGHRPQVDPAHLPDRLVTVFQGASGISGQFAGMQIAPEVLDLAIRIGLANVITHVRHEIADQIEAEATLASPRAMQRLAALLARSYAASPDSPKED